ncbi:MAG: hypothetical protein KBS64_01785 [Treponema sp.]|nr:hypothetical protein [Candidatus Treponema equi]
MKIKVASKKKSISSVITKINTTFLATGLSIFAAACLAFTYFSTLNIITTTMRTEAEAASKRVEWVIRSYKNIVKGICSIPELSTPKFSTAAKELILKNKANEFELDFCRIINPDGYSDMDNIYRGDREYFKEAMKGKVTVNDPMVSRTTGQVSILMGAPVWKGGIYNGHIDSALVCGLDIKFFNEVIKDFKISKNCDPYIIAKDGIPVASLNEARVFSRISNIKLAEKNENLRKIAEFEKNSLDGNISIRYIWKDMGLYCYSSAPIAGSSGWSMIICAPISDYMFTFWLAFAFIGFMAIIIIVISRHLIVSYSHNISGPVEQMAERLRQAAVGDFKSEVNYDDSLKEVKIIADATQSLINRMDSVLNGTKNSMSASDLTKYVDFEQYKIITENFERDVGLNLCVIDNQMNRIIGTADQGSSQSYTAPIMVNKKTIGKYVVSPKDYCTLQEKQIQSIADSMSYVVGHTIENIYGRELRYKAWKDNETVNIDNMAKNSEKMSKEILVWAETLRSINGTGSASELKKAIDEIEKKARQFSAMIQENYEFARYTDYNYSISEKDYELADLLKKLEADTQKDAENKDNIKILSKEKPEETLFGDKDSIEKIVRRIILCLEKMNPSSEIATISSVRKETYGYTLQFKFVIEKHSLSPEQIKALKEIENKANGERDSMSSNDLKMRSAYNLLWHMNGSAKTTAAEENRYELLVEIPQL